MKKAPPTSPLPILEQRSPRIDEFYIVPGAAQLVRMFTKTHVAFKLRKIWKIQGHFWNALAFLHLIEGKKHQILTLEQCIKCSFSEQHENPLARIFFTRN